MIRQLRQGLLPFRIERSEEPLVARGGLVIAYEMAQALRLSPVIDRELPSPGSGHSYLPSQFVMPIVLMLHGGGRKLAELREIEGEVSLRELLEMERLPAVCTLGDWLRRMGQGEAAGLNGLGRVNEHVVAEVLKRDSRTGYTLDVDATVIEVEKAEALWTYQKEKGYQPLLGFLFELGLCVADEFRDGNIPAGAGALEFLRRCQAKMPKGKRIVYYRADSASYQASVIDHCFSQGMLFTITGDLDSAVREAVRGIPKGEWRPYWGDREVAETIHTMGHTKEAFRLVVQRWPKLQAELFDGDRYCYHIIATNREEKAEEVIALHNQRGQAENFIKELKEGFGMEWMPCGETYANAVFFRIGVIAYNLFQAMKLVGLPPWWRNSTIATVRWRLYQTAGRVVRHGHQLVLKLAASVDKLSLFLQVRRGCLQMSYG